MYSAKMRLLFWTENAASTTVAGGLADSKVCNPASPGQREKGTPPRYFTCRRSMISVVVCDARSFRVPSNEALETRNVSRVSAGFTQPELPEVFQPRGPEGVPPDEHAASASTQAASAKNISRILSLYHIGERRAD